MFMLRVRSLCTQKEITSDICIVGNGLVGNSLLTSINSHKNNKFKITMIGRDKKPFNSENFKYKQTTSRVFTLNLQSKLFLQRIGVWDIISQKNATEIVHKIKVFDSYGGFVKFEDTKLPLAFTADEKMLDYIIHDNINNKMNCNIYNKIHNTDTDVNIKNNFENNNSENIDKNIDNKNNYSFISQKINSINQDKEFVYIKLDNDILIKSRLLAACDGANSLTAELIDKPPLKYDYNMHSLSMTVETKIDEKNVAITKFTKEGIFAFLPLGDKFYSLIWSANSETISDAESMDDESLVKRMNYVLKDDKSQSDIIGSITEKIGNLIYSLYPGKTAGVYSENFEPVVKSIIPNSRCSFPLSFKMQKCFYDGRVVFLGDSAHKVLPISGHGLNLGFGDVELFSEMLCKQWIPDNNDSLKFLCKYNRERQLKAGSIASLTTVLKGIYMSNNEKIGAISAGGLRLLHLADPIKKILIQNARY